ncbi:C cytochrome precursor [Stieleria sp. JC731]|uniref:multiheme c-type cytochrome n=1 Tax=Pirellulaceae TaxID=2691357 RepID=UPI001E6530C2|nr:multiheme c-type cytochrome [Stieleria sp. JC731]MCC9603857.1 C cytochrome precursor [Stieleria sp. JC731]
MELWFIALSCLAIIICLYIGIRYRSVVVFLSTTVLALFALALIMPSEKRTTVSVTTESTERQKPTTESKSAGDTKSGKQSDQQVASSEKDRKQTEVTLTTLESFRPIEVPNDGYVGSDACKECHAENHATWEASYHSTMTQVADPEIVLGDFSDVSVQCQGQNYRMTMQDGVCSVITVNPDDPTKPVSAPVVMTTGSHHMQVYWFATGNRRLLGMFPLVHLNETGEWIPRQSAFLVPPGLSASFEMGRWNETCSGCHSTQPKSRRLSSGDWDTHVGEFGISCEACHGPGQEHLDFRSRSKSQNSDSLQARDPEEQDPIINPANLSKVRSAQVCGQCHSVIDPKSTDADFQEKGHQYRPGKDLLETHSVWLRSSPEFENTRKTLNYPDLETLLNETYYPDGMIRVSGREYNGLIRSPCYIKGEMTCLSCHDLHQDNSDDRPIKEWANDQLSQHATEDHACTQCHSPEKYGSSHTHHAAESSGSSCYNCHMPHTTYGLLKAIRSHQISSPNVGADRDAKRTNACNLCHLDQTLAWSAKHLEDWYQTEPPVLDKTEQTVAASVIWLTRSDAAQRAITAWHMGWDVAQSTSGNNWQLPLLTALLDDDYEAIRLIARRSIRSLPGGESFEFDLVTSSTSEQRQRQALKLLSGWLAKDESKQINRPELLILGNEGIAVDQLRSLIDQRDNTPITLSE